MALTKTPIELSSTPSIVDGGNATAITIDSSENVTLAGTLSSGAITSSGNISLGGSDGDNAVLTLAANTGNWVFTNVQANRNLEISDSDGTGTVLTIATDGDFFLNTTSAMANCFVSFQDGNNGEAMFGISAKNDSNVGIRLGVGTDRKWVMYRNTSDDLIFYNNASSGERIRLLDAGGIAFNGDTAAANALDDYEEGTWTPTTASDASPSAYNYQTGYYTKTGRVVHITGQLRVSNMGSMSGATTNIGGLPFNIVNLTNYDPRGHIGLKGAANAKSEVFCRGVSNSNHVRIEANNGATADDRNMNSNAIDTGTVLFIDLTYIAV